MMKSSSVNVAVPKVFGVTRPCGDRLDAGASLPESWLLHHSKSSRESKGEDVRGICNTEVGSSDTFALLVAIDAPF